MNVGRIAELTTPTPAAAPKSTTEQSAKKDTTTSADRPHVDKFEKQSETTYTPAYTKQTVKSQSESSTEKGIKVEKPKSSVAMKNEAFTSMVKDIIGKQGGAAWNAIMADADKIQNGTIDDYWSAEATADRIYNFARTLAGGDSSKLETLRKAVDKGFAQAGAAFSKKYGQSGLPSICQDTYKLIQDKFDEWAKEGSGSTTTSAASSSSDKKSTFTPSGYSVTNPKYNPKLNNEKKAD